MPADLKSDCEKVLAALEGAARLSRTDVYNRIFQHHRSSDYIDTVGAALEDAGRILRLRLDPGGGKARRPTEVWEIITVQSAINGNGAVAVTPPTDESVAEQPAGPPPGDGWLPKAKTLRQAQRGVVPAVAARAGRIVRKADAQRRGSTQPGRLRVSDEQRGATHLIRVVVKNYKDQGIIEVEDDWIRLVRNPTRRPPHHWYESLLHFLAEGHPTLDGKWHRPPKRTLVAVMEDALGRKLEETEQVRRKPGAAGSWNGNDIVLLDFEQGTITTLADVRARRLQ